MNERLKALYKSEILTRSQNPAHFGEMPEATHVLEAYNPMCGDQFKLFIQLEEKNIKSASFTGYGCAISKASTEVLTERLVGKNLMEVKQEVALFLRLISSDTVEEPDQMTTDETLLAFSGTRQHPEREQCASLSWSELAKFLAEEEGM